MGKLRNLKKVIIFALTFLIVVLMIPNFLYAIWPDIVLNPTSASIGDSLTITIDGGGGGFGAQGAGSKVTFTGSGDTTTVTSWSDTQIVLDVPTGTTTGNVTVTRDPVAGGGTSNPETLTIEPDITSINPTTASIGDALTINGTGFEDARGVNGKVTFAGSGDTTTVTSWSATQIVLNVPAGTTTGNVTVTTNALLTSDAATLTIKPDITSLNPTTAAIGQEITITGINFGNPIGAGEVTFAGSGITTAVTSWNDTEIKINVPVGTVTGDVTVTESTGVATSDPETLTIAGAGGTAQETEEAQEPESQEPDPWERTEIGYYEKTSNGFVTMLYSRFFCRPPDQDGFDKWLAWIESGDVTGEDLMKGFIFGEECQTKISDYTNSEFILFLYEVFFNRGPSDENYGIWLSRIDAGMSKEMIVTEFCHSDEFISLCSLFGIIPYMGYTVE
jgi:hypothetical protein